MRSLKKISEHGEQVRIFQWAKLMEIKYPQLKYMFSTLNGIKLSIGSAKKAKLSGNKKGVPDIIFPYKSGKYSGLMIELKIEYNKPTTEQKDYIKFTRDQGFYSQVCYGSDESIELIKNYMDGAL